MFGKLKVLSVLGVGVYLAGAACAAAQQADLNSPDLVLINGKVLTMDASPRSRRRLPSGTARSSRSAAAHRSSRWSARRLACSMWPARPSFPD